jgi:hypothetical protein
MPIDYGVHRQRMMRARVSKGNVAEQTPDEKQAEHPADQFHNEVTRHAMCGPIGVTVHRWYLVQLSVSLSARAVQTGWHRIYSRSSVKNCAALRNIAPRLCAATAKPGIETAAVKFGSISSVPAL